MTQYLCSHTTIKTDNKQYTSLSSLQSTYIVGNGSPMPQCFIAYKHKNEEAQLMLTANDKVSQKHGLICYRQ